MKVFVDTGYYVAILDARDPWHDRAMKAARSDMQFVTSSLVINETISLLQARGYLSAALTFLRSARNSESVQVVFVDPSLQSEAWDQFARWGSIGANAVDCASFALMNRFSIRRALTFDEHFRAAGFEILDP